MFKSPGASGPIVNVSVFQSAEQYVTIVVDGWDKVEPVSNAAARLGWRVHTLTGQAATVRWWILFERMP
jgi:hypothetical protein